MRSPAVAVVLALVLASTFFGKTPSAVVFGRFVAVGGPFPGAAYALSGQVDFKWEGDGLAVQVTAAGRFLVRLSPGTYTVRGTSPGIDNGQVPCSAPLTVTVRGGDGIAQDVICSIF